MNTTMQHFGLTEDEVIRKDNDFYLTISKLAVVLDTPKNNLLKNIQMNREEIGDLTVEYYSTVTGKKETYILNEEQIYVLCMISRSEKAKEFRRIFAKMIKGIRTKEFIHISEYKDLLYRYESVQEQLQIEMMRDEVLYSIDKRKLSRYKKFRKLGLSRKELCKALDLPYRKMQKADKLLGFYRSNKSNYDHLLPYQYVANSGGKRRFEIEENSLFNTPQKTEV